MNRYYQVTGKKLLGEIMKMQLRDLHQLKKAEKWAKKLGGTNEVITQYDYGGGLKIVGIVAGERLSEDWKNTYPTRSKHHTLNHWVPKKTKAGKKIQTEIDSFEIFDLKDYADKIGLKHQMFQVMGYRMSIKGNYFIAILGSKWKYKPIRGVKRISDIQFEKITGS